MPRYVIERSYTVEEAEVPVVATRSKRIARDDYPEITWEHSHIIVTDDGKVRTYCVYEAPDEDIVRRHAMALGNHVVDVLYEIAGDVSPSDYPDSNPKT